VFNVSLGIILVATAAALSLNDARRTFWRGFCLIAWIYMLIAFVPMENQLRERLVTDRILAPLHRVLAPLQAARHVEPGFKLQRENEWVYRTGPDAEFHVAGVPWQLTQRTGHSAWAILLGVAGGYLAMNFSKSHAVQRPAE
jgi:hypothetical protein